MQIWGRFKMVSPEGGEIGTWVIEGPCAPDLGTVGEVAAAALFARRLGGRLCAEEVSPELSGLLSLAGLPVEMWGQTEACEEIRCVEEREEHVHGRDLPA
jgi:hypothetical protein